MGLPNDDPLFKAPVDEVTGRPPPWWMGPIFMAFGIVIAIYATPTPGTPFWVAYCACAVFGFAGVYLTLMTMGYPRMAVRAMFVAATAFVVLFNWAGFGPGERIGSSSFGFGGGGISVSNGSTGQNVKPYFAVFTGFMDLIIVIGIWKKLRRAAQEKRHIT